MTDMGKLNVGLYHSAREALDVALMREVLKALEATTDLLRTEARKHHDNLEPVQELRVLKVLNPTRAAITKLEQRLLNE